MKPCRQISRQTSPAFIALALIGAALAPAALAPSAQAQQRQNPGASADNFPFVYVNHESGETDTVRGNVVPLWPGRACFGWQLKIGGRDRQVQVKEILTLSGPTTTWVAGPETKISPDQSTATTVLPATTEEGRVSRAWCITEGDPPGQYRYDIYIDGVQRGQFIYCAVEMKYDPDLNLGELTCPYKFEQVRRIDLPPIQTSQAQ